MRRAALSLCLVTLSIAACGEDQPRPAATAPETKRPAPPAPSEATAPDAPESTAPVAARPAVTSEPAPKPAPRAPAPRGDAARGKALVAEFECGRCHLGTGHPEPPVEKQCVGCHVKIHAGTFDADAETLADWQKTIVDLIDVPSLTSTDNLLRRDWIEAFLLDPHDVRPRLSATMPRLTITPDQARDIATYLAPSDPVRSDLSKADPARGRALLDTKGCGTCHVFSGVPPLKVSPIPTAMEAKLQSRGMTIAPDLRFTRERVRPAALVAWLLDPTARKPDTAMPAVRLSLEEVKDIARYLLETPLQPQPTQAIPARLPALTRDVRYEEVEKKIFRHTCWHCHADSEYVEIGDGGPGNTGGLGYKGKGINLADYSGVASGYTDANGERQSLFAKDAAGVPFLVASLMARYAEVAGKPIAGVRGMPLGLPPLPLEDVQLLESWIAQGRPQ